MVHLPVLCYQNIDPVLHDDLTYKAGNIKNHFRILKENGYETITCHHLCENLNGKRSLPDKPIIITFDNGYAAYCHYLLEPLQENNFNATFFITGGWAWKSTCKERGFDQLYMNIEQLRYVQQKGFELAMHSYNYTNFSDTLLTEIQSDIANNISFFKKFSLAFTNVIAFPQDFNLSRSRRKNDISWLLCTMNITAAFQPGTKSNVVDRMNPYEINRILVSETISCNNLLKKIASKGYKKLW